MIMLLVINHGGIILKDAIIVVPDENDFAFADVLRSLGVNRNVSMLITYMRGVKEATSREIEIATGLRQPEVSIAMRTLRGNNWILEKEIKHEGKGRPMKAYSLQIPIGEIIEFFEAQKRQESAQMLQNISKLKELITA